jgi:type IV pilus assembly protein PilM
MVKSAPSGADAGDAAPQVDTGAATSIWTRTAMTRTVVGLDIGGSGVRAAELEVGRRTTLRRYAEVPLPAGVVRAGLVVDGDALTTALRELWSQGGFSTKSVVLGIANDAVLVRQMDLDWMPPADFRKALRYQVADALPMSVDDANLDYHLLEKTERPGDGDGGPRSTARILLVAAGRDMVDAFVRAVKSAGLRPERLDLVPFALVRAATAAEPTGSGLEAVVDIGADTVVVVVHQHGQPGFVRTLTGHGGQETTRVLMERYDWTWEEAERSKVVLGLPGHTRTDAYADHPSAPDLGTLTDHPARAVIAERADALVAELRTTLDYFRTSLGGNQQLSRLLITGRAADLGGLQQVLERELAVPVQRLDVLAGVRTSRKVNLPPDPEACLPVAAGLCLAVAS